MTYNFHNVIEILVSFLAILFAVYLFTSSSKNKYSNTFIAFVLILFAINISHNFIEVYVDVISVNLSVFIMMSAYLMAPSLFLYSKSSIDTNFRLSKKNILHLVPFIFFNILIIPSVYLVNLGDDGTVVETNNYINGVLYIQIFFYLIWIYKELWQYKQIYFENFSNTDTRKFKYLFQLNSIVSVVFITSAFKNYFIFISDGKLLQDSIYVVLLMILLLFCWIIYKGLNSPELFNRSIKDLESVDTLVRDDKVRMATTGVVVNNIIQDKESEGLAFKVKEYMEKEKPYLNPALSLYDLARQTCSITATVHGD